MLAAADLALAAGAAVLGGAVNALAGGGSLLTFPALVAAGLPPVVANVTNTVALCPGYLGATLAQRGQLAGQGRRAAVLLPVAAVGGAAGALLLLGGEPRAFEALVPYLLLLAAALIAAQGRLRAHLARRPALARGVALAALPVGAAAVYGGYFGAGLGVMLLAALGVALPDDLARLSALKQVVSLVVNVVAAAVFVARGPVHAPAALIMAGAALAGGALGGALAARVPVGPLRAGIVVLAIGVAVAYLAR